MARRYFAGLDPIGRRFAISGPRQQLMDIVGVAGDIITAGPDPTSQPAFYMPYAQVPLPVMTIVMRVPRGNPSAPALEAERTAWSVAPDTNVYAVETMAARMRDLYWRTRFSALLLGGFAVLAVLLGAAGIYAVISYTVFQRRGEIGLRLALGASGRDIAAMVLKSGLRPVAAGLAAGGLAAIAATRVLAGLLYGVAPGDPATLSGVALLIVVVAIAACLGPAIRAMRVDPQTVMRS
jgi:predicted lysophospholipase L1 biosynthesis ABC-type transport system permease subunit